MIIHDYAHMLSSTTDEVLDKMAEYEKKGLFNEHLEEMMGEYKPVDKDFDYLAKPTFKMAMQNIFLAKPFCRYVNKKLFKTEVHGRENIKDLKGAIVCCNHVNKLDCVALQLACRPHKTYITAAQFNNMGGLLGDMMRINGMLPIGEGLGAMRNLDNTITKLLERGDFVAFYPERAEWWGYEKPRPLMFGAYHYAVKNNVPVVPVFITFRPTPASIADRKGLKQFVVNIGKPIYVPEGMSPSSAKDYLMEENAKAWDEIYRSFYNK